MAKSSNLEYTKLVLLCLGLLAIMMTEAKRDLHHGTKKHEMTVDTVVEKSQTTGRGVVVKTHTTAGWSVKSLAAHTLATSCCTYCDDINYEACQCSTYENDVKIGEDKCCLNHADVPCPTGTLDRS